ncbi:hypothetical protein G4G27_15115 [Sphingomonas sp. So64.6b]|nr:hypothetical protein G4G27_15115 [Sphingomonas sp. So64.6b]
MPGTILAGTAVSGTLDLLSAVVFAGMAGTSPLGVLRSVGSGPFGDWAVNAGALGALAGLLTHYAIMTVMVATFVIAAKRLPKILDGAVFAGLLYGVALYIIMYWIVLPLRFPAYVPKTDLWGMGNALFSHCICVGLPMALIARKYLRG